MEHCDNSEFTTGDWSCVDLRNAWCHVADCSAVLWHRANLPTESQILRLTIFQAESRMNVRVAVPLWDWGTTSQWHNTWTDYSPCTFSLFSRLILSVVFGSCSYGGCNLFFRHRNSTFFTVYLKFPFHCTKLSIVAFFLALFPTDRILQWNRNSVILSIFAPGLRCNFAFAEELGWGGSYTEQRQCRSLFLVTIDSRCMTSSCLISSYI
jgi:hypothetical protein